MTMTLSALDHSITLIGTELDIAPDVQIGPHVVIEGPVRIEGGCIIEGHACLRGPLTMGRDNFVGAGAILGGAPQSHTYHGEPTHLRIGNRNTFCEFVTIHRGTVAGGGETSIGDDNQFLVGAHAGHDVRIGNGCTISGQCLLAGHVTLFDRCFLAPHAVVQQRSRIGRLALLEYYSAATRDVPPFMCLEGYSCLTVVNVAGMREAGIGPDVIEAVCTAYRILYSEGRARLQACSQIEAELGAFAEVQELLDFIRDSRVGISIIRKADRQTWDL